VDRVAGFLGPKLDDAIDDFAARLTEFVAQAGDALAKGIAEVLDRALAEKRTHTGDVAASAEAQGLDAALRAVRTIDERIADVRQTVWEDAAEDAAEPAPDAAR
jgi:hypothetical protein